MHVSLEWVPLNIYQKGCLGKASPGKIDGVIVDTFSNRRIGNGMNFTGRMCPVILHQAFYCSVPEMGKELGRWGFRACEDVNRSSHIHDVILLFYIFDCNKTENCPTVTVYKCGIMLYWTVEMFISIPPQTDTTYQTLIFSISLDVLFLSVFQKQSDRFFSNLNVNGLPHLDCTYK